MTATKLDSNKALVVLSGGQDSTTCFYWAIKKYGRENVFTVTFDYGQRHKIELESARRITDFAKVNFDLLSIPQVLRSTSPLVDLDTPVGNYNSVDDLPGGLEPTFVPGRNILFLTLAANIAYAHKAANIICGVCQEDFGGYYDCRQDFVDAMQKALNQGMIGCDDGFNLETPLMDLSKKESVVLAASLGNECLEALSYSHTCYEGKFPPCGKCHSCLLRARGFEEAGVLDPLLARI